MPPCVRAPLTTLDGTIYPVEYKHGPRRAWINDDVQLAAQAMCLEEMFDTVIASGAIYHSGSKRRREVAISEALRIASMPQLPISARLFRQVSCRHR